MNEKLKETFHHIRAEDALKESTRAFLLQKTHGYTRVKAAKSLYACAAACLMLLLAGGRWLYLTPTAEIDIDINPSIQLGVNRFDRIISVNDNSPKKLVNASDLKFRRYTDAIDQILSNEKITFLLSSGEVMTVTVTGPDDAQSSKLLSGLEACTTEQKNTYCYCASSEEMAAAHDAGLSYGKYQAYLELKRLDPSITSETIRGMTMRQLRDQIATFSADNSRETLSGGCSPVRSEFHNQNGCGRQNGRKRHRAGK